MDGAGKGWAALWLMSVVVLASCGPRLVSALGNPAEACPEGSQCLELEDGFRCVAATDDEGGSAGTAAPRAPVRRGPSGGPVVVEDQSVDDEAVSETETEGETVDDDEAYEPPSSRRRRQE